MKKMISICLMSLTIMVNVGCGSSGGDGDPILPTPTPTNVALASNGSSVTSTFTTGAETFTTDGDTTTTSFWNAGVDGDSVTVQFDKTYTLSNVTIRHLQMNSNTEFELALSTDGTNFTSISIFSDCINMTLSTSIFVCDLAQQASHVQLTILLDSANIEIYEIEATGI